MAVTIPSIDDLYDGIMNDYTTNLGVSVSELGNTYVVRAKVLAGLVYPAYLTASGVQQNVYYDLAEEDQLIRYGQQILQRNPAPAN